MSESTRTSGIEAEADDSSPFLVRCGSCGAPADFDIRNHTYKCAHCGAETEASSPLKSLDGWRMSARTGRKRSLERNPAAVCTCPGCGAVVAVNEGEMSATCAFCGGTMARRPATGEDAIPEVVIPFVLTGDDAQRRLDRWLELHGRDRCAKALQEHRGELKAMFLPYRLVKGPVRCDVTRQGSDRTYQCGAYVDGVAINASKDLPNDVLDAMEPYDWSEARAFHWGYLSGGQTARFPDVSRKEMEKRTLEELEDDCLPMVEKTLMTTGVTVKARMDGDVMDMPALLPVYVIASKGFRCFVNGQTGRVVVSDGSSDREGNRWWLPPVVLSALFAWFYWAFTAASHVYVLEGPDKAPIFTTLLKYMLPFGQRTLFSADTFAMIMRQGVMWTSPFILLVALLVVFSKNRAVATRAHIPATPACRASREGDGVTLVVSEGKGAVLDSVSAMPVFFEDDPSATGPASSRQGKSGTSRKADGGSPAAGDSEASDYWSSLHLVPVRIRFYPPRRIVRWSLQVLLTAFLPTVVCGGARLLFDIPFFPPALLACQFLWCVLVVPWPMSRLVKRIGIQVFDNPAIQRIHPDGTLSWMDKGKEESVFSGLFMIATPILGLFERSWKLGCVGAMCLGPLPLVMVVGPMLDETGNDLEQTASKGSSFRMMESMFASSHDLTREEWDALPQVSALQFMAKATQPLAHLENKSGRYERIQKRIHDALGEKGRLDFMRNPEDVGQMTVRIPATRGHGHKALLGVASEKTYPTLRMSVIAVKQTVPKDKVDLVVDYLEAVQAALPGGGFGLGGKDEKYVYFTSGLNVYGLKRIPDDWRDLATMWPLDVMETVESRLNNLISGKSTDTTANKTDMERLTKDYWEMAVMEGKKYRDFVPDATPGQILKGFRAFFDRENLKPYELKDGVLSMDARWSDDVVIHLVVDSTVQERAVVLRGQWKSNQVRSLSREKRRELRWIVFGYNNMGTYQGSMDVESGDLYAAKVLPLRLLKSVPEDFYQRNFHDMLGYLGAVEDALMNGANAPSAEQDGSSQGAPPPP